MMLSSSIVDKRQESQRLDIKINERECFIEIVNSFESELDNLLSQEILKLSSKKKKESSKPEQKAKNSSSNNTVQTNVTFTKLDFSPGGRRKSLGEIAFDSAKQLYHTDNSSSLSTTKDDGQYYNLASIRRFLDGPVSRGIVTANNISINVAENISDKPKNNSNDHGEIEEEEDPFPSAPPPFEDEDHFPDTPAKTNNINKRRRSSVAVDVGELSIKLDKSRNATPANNSITFMSEEKSPHRPASSSSQQLLSSSGHLQTSTEKQRRKSIQFSLHNNGGSHQSSKNSSSSKQDRTSDNEEDEEHGRLSFNNNYDDDEKQQSIHLSQKSAMLIDQAEDDISSLKKMLEFDGAHLVAEGCVSLAKRFKVGHHRNHSNRNEKTPAGGGIVDMSFLPTMKRVLLLVSSKFKSEDNQHNNIEWKRISLLCADEKEQQQDGHNNRDGSSVPSLLSIFKNETDVDFAANAVSIYCTIASSSSLVQEFHQTNIDDERLNIHRLRVCENGWWRDLILDDWMPVVVSAAENNGTKETTTINNNSNSSSSSLSSLLSYKALAKMNKSYVEAICQPHRKADVYSYLEDLTGGFFVRYDADLDAMYNQYHRQKKDYDKTSNLLSLFKMFVSFFVEIINRKFLSSQQYLVIMSVSSSVSKTLAEKYNLVPNEFVVLKKVDLIFDDEEEANNNKNTKIRFEITSYSSSRCSTVGNHSITTIEDFIDVIELFDTLGVLYDSHYHHSSNKVTQQQKELRIRGDFEEYHPSAALEISVDENDLKNNDDRISFSFNLHQEEQHHHQEHAGNNNGHKNKSHRSSSFLPIALRVFERTLDKTATGNEKEVYDLIKSTTVRATLHNDDDEQEKSTSSLTFLQSRNIGIAEFTPKEIGRHKHHKKQRRTFLVVPLAYNEEHHKKKKRKQETDVFAFDNNSSSSSDDEHPHEIDKRNYTLSCQVTRSRNLMKSINNHQKKKTASFTNSIDIKSIFIDPTIEVFDFSEIFAIDCINNNKEHHHNHHQQLVLPINVISQEVSHTATSTNKIRTRLRSSWQLAFENHQNGNETDDDDDEDNLELVGSYSNHPEAHNFAKYLQSASSVLTPKNQGQQEQNNDNNLAVIVQNTHRLMESVVGSLVALEGVIACSQREDRGDDMIDLTFPPISQRSIMMNNDSMLSQLPWLRVSTPLEFTITTTSTTSLCFGVAYDLITDVIVNTILLSSSTTKLIRKIFCCGANEKEENRKGYHRVRLLKDSCWWEEVIVDNWLPFVEEEENNNNDNIIFGNGGGTKIAFARDNNQKNNLVWISFLQKALAKSFGSYQNLFQIASSSSSLSSNSNNSNRAGADDSISSVNQANAINRVFGTEVKEILHSLPSSSASSQAAAVFSTIHNIIHFSEEKGSSSSIAVVVVLKKNALGGNNGQDHHQSRCVVISHSRKNESGQFIKISFLKNNNNRMKDVFENVDNNTTNKISSSFLCELNEIEREQDNGNYNDDDSEGVNNILTKRWITIETLLKMSQKIFTIKLPKDYDDDESDDRRGTSSTVVRVQRNNIPFVINNNNNSKATNKRLQTNILRLKCSSPKSVEITITRRGENVRDGNSSQHHQQQLYTCRLWVADTTLSHREIASSKLLMTSTMTTMKIMLTKPVTLLSIEKEDSSSSSLPLSVVVSIVVSSSTSTSSNRLTIEAVKYPATVVEPYSSSSSTIKGDDDNSSSFTVLNALHSLELESTLFQVDDTMTFSSDVVKV